METTRPRCPFSRLSRLFPILLTVACSLALAEQVLETYRVRHRPARELLAVAQAALGDQGHASLDARTATLILNGTATAVGRALRLLEQMDRSLHQLVLTYEIRGLSELQGMEAQVRWKHTNGSVRIGTLPVPMDELHIGGAAHQKSTRRRLRSTLRLLEGSSGLIITGEALPFVYQDTREGLGWELVPAETGFAVEATMLGERQIQVELRPFSGRFEEGGALRYTEARTSITLSPGETVVLGKISRQSREQDIDLQGVRARRHKEQAVLLFSVELERP